jgi:N-acetylglucosaminyldiphosphoundecaprenol N-acetyl-beta-D-mannosaminyltransferase
MSYSILGTHIDATSYPEATQQVLAWARDGGSKYVIIANVNNVMEAFDSPAYREVLNQADLVTPDGMPVVWTLRALGAHGQTRVYGPTLTMLVLRAAALEGIPVGFFGSTPKVLDGLVTVLHDRFPGLRINYQFSPPFRELSRQEDEQIVEAINDSGARILFVGLGSPKQDTWMAIHRQSLHTVMLGVGAAFDFIAGTKRQAPAWMQKNGLEWLFRLLQEPGRLWRRYLYHNPRFIVLVLMQLLKRE